MTDSTDEEYISGSNDKAAEVKEDLKRMIFDRKRQIEIINAEINVLDKVILIVGGA